ncbi:hypothetical protein E4V42_12235 [Clostridium estertheticum]|uniref:ApeA N-terminal domain-containing protein n=1 Tax=Clostridium estertheticum TaxID=238834 RepID=A0A5N7IPL6_9CLOT|nr:hypothetical protein [Clostridium estertheticum]MPQ32196.1 hypothetical protein [Clostridium estertheticum]MPQ62856.1 hypothetical protein [Clostridium estertheticum]
MNYKIEVLFNESNKENIIYDDKSYYTETLYDHITISNCKIAIKGSRSKNIPIESIITNITSTLYKQILKALVFAYMSTGTQYQILEIKLYKNINGKEMSFIENNIVQPYLRPLNREYCIVPDRLKILFSNSSKIDILLNSIILFIKGFQENNFDYYWKSFNCLYTGISGKDKEFQKLIFIRGFIEKNQPSFRSSLDLMDKDDKNDIRSLRIRDFILNNFPTRHETEQFKEFIMRFTDYRMNQMFDEVLPYRKEFLNLEGMLADVQSHITFHKDQGLKSNEQLLCFYILKYSYYLRNKYFHAEKTVPVFILKSNNELIELDKINQIMCTFIIDIFNCNHLYL